MDALPSSLDGIVVRTLAGKHYRLDDLVRKKYRVEVSASWDGVLWDDQHDKTIYDHSERAAQSADSLRAQGFQARVIVHFTSNVPKKAFWDLWKDDEGKKLLKASGVHVTCVNDTFVITDQAVTKRQVIRSKGYGRRRSYDEMSAKERGMYWAAMKDAQDFRDEPATFRKEKAHVNAVFLGGSDPYDKNDSLPSRPKPRVMKTPETVEVCNELAD